MSQSKWRIKKWDPPLTKQEKAVVNDLTVDDVPTLMEITSFISFTRKKEATPFLDNWKEIWDNPKFAKVKQVLEKHGNLLSKQIEIETKTREELKEKLIENWDKLSFEWDIYIYYPQELIYYPPAEWPWVKEGDKKRRVEVGKDIDKETYQQIKQKVINDIKENKDQWHIEEYPYYEKPIPFSKLIGLKIVSQNKKQHFKWGFSEPEWKELEQILPKTKTVFWTGRRQFIGLILAVVGILLSLLFKSIIDIFVSDRQKARKVLILVIFAGIIIGFAILLINK